MNSFEKQWPVTQDLTVHQEQFDAAVKSVEQFIVVPKDGRVRVAMANYTQGGPTSFTAIRGEASTAKTDLENMVFQLQRQVREFLHFHRKRSQKPY